MDGWHVSLAGTGFGHWGIGRLFGYNLLPFYPLMWGKGEGIVMQELEEAPLRGGPSFYWSVESTRAFPEILIDRMILRPIVPQLGDLPATKLFVWPGASLWALGKQSHLVDIWELAKNSTKEGLSGKEAIRQHRKSGTLFTALYLKQCAVSLQQAYAGSESPKTLLPFPVSLTRSGYPMTFLWVSCGI